MSMKITRFLGVLLAALVVLGSFAITASAQEKDSTKDVTLTIYALQTNVGSEVTVDASVTGEKLTIPDKTPIAGVSFVLYLADSEGNSEDTPSFTTDLSDETGAVTLTVPASKQGRYLVMENERPKNAVGNMIPFYVDLPMTAPNGTDYMYEVFAYPKQQMEEEEGEIEILPNPEITKKVSEDDGKTWGEKGNIASIIGHKAYWKVSVLVPSSASKMNYFTVNDVIDDRLIPPAADEVKASVAGKALSDKEFKAEVNKQKITVSFDPSLISVYQDKWIDIIYPTAIDLDADKAVGELIPNVATLTFTKLSGAPDIGSDTDIDVPGPGDGNTTTTVSTIESPVVEVWTSAIYGLKHDEDKKPLAGAEFTLYSDKECKNKIFSATSDKDGKFSFVGLRDGTYYLKETKTPSGYQANNNVLTASVKMKDNKTTSIDVVNIKEKKKETLPVTGGAGIIGISLVGLAIAVTGGLLITLAIKARRKSGAEA